MFSQSFSENRRSSSYSDLSHHGFQSQNSQEMFSQSFTAPFDTHHSHSDSQQNPGTSDYWSQSSSQQDDAHLNYSKRPLLFASKIKKTQSLCNVLGGGGGLSSGSSYAKFQEVQQQKVTANNQKDILQSFSKLLEESSSELKGFLESLHVEITKDVQSSVKSIKCNLENNDYLLNKLQFDVVESLKNSSKEALSQSVSETELKLKHKDEKICELEDKVKQLQKEIANFNEKENLFHKDQISRLNNLLSQINATNAAVKTMKSPELDLKMMQLVEQNNTLCALVNHLISLQESSTSSLVFLKEKFLCLPNYLQQSVINPQNLQNQNHFSSQVHPYPFDKALKLSPVAVVAPTIQVKQNIATDNFHNDLLETNLSDLYSKQKNLPIVSHNENECVQKKHCEKQIRRTENELPFSNMCLTSTTPNIARVDQIKKTTPIQRSIRRYGKIKKSVDLFSPALNSIKKCQPLKDDQNINEKKLEHCESWKELIVLEKSTAVSVCRTSSTTSTRGSLVMKRKQENVLNFEKDDSDLKDLVLLLRGKGKSIRLAP
ncbi:uncharacterized protein LOC101240264 isoform X1 [Hydra vulgaris]|uniref:uncharacterized protein LOC101240264 isoform X1 n=1 Tax=Hydra vulgaris TaxID=6087 RepID=UPI001F5F829B|nr:uncharacterized protein LOC101240264 isoform X3 [Hydra vulgaris]